MVPVNVAVAATLVMLHLFFRKDIPRCYALTRLPIPQDAIRDRATFRNRLGGIGAVADGFLRPGAARCAGKFGRRLRCAGSAGGGETRTGDRYR